MFIKTAIDIKNSLVNFYSKVQNKITDFGPVSVVGGLFYAFAVELEGLYTELEEVKKQAYVATATGNNLDRLIDGTYGLSRSPKTRASGYVTLYSNSTITDPDNLILRCAYFDSNGVLQDVDKAEKFISSGDETNGGRVFVLVVPESTTAIKELTDRDGTKFKAIDLKGNAPRLLILPVVSMLEGVENNVPEGTITSYPRRPSGVDGVLNTYDPQATFFATPDSYDIPFSIRYSNVIELRTNSDGETLVDVTLAYYFSERGGMLEFEDMKGQKIKGRYYKTIANYPFYDDTVYEEKNLQLEYKEAQTGAISLLNPLGAATTIADSMAELPTFNRRIEADNGTVFNEQWVMREVLYDGVITELVEGVPLPGQKLLGYLNDRVKDLVPDPNYPGDPSRTVSNFRGLVVRQVQVDIDKDVIFDPDNVISTDTGRIKEGAYVGGATDIEGDESYRLKLKKYLSSLPRATDDAIEAGALQVPGVNFAKIIKDRHIPHGSTVLLVSSTGGTVDRSALFNLKATLDDAWKASGVRLIIKTPQKVDITSMMTITVAKGYSKDYVDEQVKVILKNYIRGKNPGETINYSDIITSISEADGVQNVWNLFFGKRLSTDFYLLNKGTQFVNPTGGKKMYGYDYEVLKATFNNPSNNVHSTPFLTNLPKNEEDTFWVLDRNEDNPNIFFKNGLPYIPSLDDDNYKRVRVKYGDTGLPVRIDYMSDAAWDKFAANLRAINTAQGFMEFVTTNHEDIFWNLRNDVLKQNYLLTKWFSEVAVEYDPALAGNIPVDVKHLELRFLSDFKMGTFQVPVISSIFLARQVVPLIGVEYLLE